MIREKNELTVCRRLTAGADYNAKLLPMDITKRKFIGLVELHRDRDERKRLREERAPPLERRSDDEEETFNTRWRMLTRVLPELRTRYREIVNSLYHVDVREVDPYVNFKLICLSDLHCEYTQTLSYYYRVEKREQFRSLYFENMISATACVEYGQGEVSFRYDILCDQIVDYMGGFTNEDIKFTMLKELALFFDVRDRRLKALSERVERLQVSVQGVDEPASESTYYSSSYNIMLDAALASLPYTCPDVNKSGLSDLLLFARGIYAAKGKEDVLLSAMNLANVLQARFGHDYFRKEIDHYIYSYVAPLFSGVNDEARDVSTVIHGVDGSWIKSDAVNTAAAKCNEYFEKVQKQLESFVNTNVEFAMPALPEWNPDWTIYISTMKNSKLYEACCDLIKYATALFALLSFLDKDKTKEMMEKVTGSTWFESVKLMGTFSLVIYGVFAIYRECSGMYIRYVTGQPLFKLDELTQLHLRADKIYAKLDEKLKDIQMDSLKRKVVSTQLSREYDELGMEVRNFNMKNIMNLKPDIRRSLEGLNTKMVKLEAAVVQDFNGSNAEADEPFSWTLLGGPGIGKSLLASDLHIMLAAALQQPSALENRFVIDIHSKYDDTYKKCMWGCLFDDYGASNPEKDPDACAAIKRPISIISPIPCPVVKAKVEEKGKNFHNYLYVGFTANNPYLAIKTVMLTPAAILRRMGLIIRPVLRDEFKDKFDATKLNYTKWNTCKLNNSFPDGYPWKFMIGYYANSGQNHIIPLENSRDFYSFDEMMTIVKTKAIEKTKSRSAKAELQVETCNKCNNFKFTHVGEECRRPLLEMPDGPVVVNGIDAGKTIEDYEDLKERYRQRALEASEQIRNPSLELRTKRWLRKISGKFKQMQIPKLDFKRPNFIDKLKNLGEERYSTVDRFLSFGIVALLKYFLVMRKFVDLGIDELSLTILFTVITFLYFLLGPSYGFFLIVGTSIYVGVYLYRHDALNKRVLANNIDVHWRIALEGKSGLVNKWALFEFLDPKAAQVITFTLSVTAIILAGVALKKLFAEDNETRLHGVEVVKEMDDKQFRRVFWRSATVAGALATAGYFVAKHYSQEEHVTAKMCDIAIHARIRRFDDEFKCGTSGYRFRNSVNIPKHAVIGEWAKKGLLDESGLSVIQITAVGKSMNKRVITKNVRLSDFGIDEFDMCSLRVFDEWGTQSVKLDDLYIDCPVDAKLELVGADGFICLPLREQKIRPIKFVETIDNYFGVDDQYGSVFGHRYINTEGMKKLNYILEEDTVNGDCHSLLTARISNKFAIVGVHTQMERRRGLTINVGGGITLSRGKLERLDELALFAYKKSHKGFEGMLTPIADVGIKDVVHEKSVFITKGEEHNVLPLGQIDQNFRANPESRVVKTLVCDLFEEDLKATGSEFGPPVMKGYLNEKDEWVTPYDKVVDATKPNPNPISTALFEEAAREFYEDVTDGYDIKRFTRVFGEIPDEDLHKEGFLSYSETLNGFADGQDIFKMNLKSSAGSRFPGKKEDYVIRDEELSEKAGRPMYRLVDEVRARIANKIRLIGTGEREIICSIVRTQLKDEVRKKGKRARPFYIADFDELFIMRMMLSKILWFLKDRKSHTENYVGTNCASGAWRAFRDHLAVNGDACIDMDFESFDLLIKRAYTSIIYFEVYVPLAEFLGYSKDEVRILKGALASSLFIFLNLNGDLFLTDGFNPSGGVDTVEINCVFNAILHRMVFNALKRKSLNPLVWRLRFRLVVKAGFYGDDVLQSVASIARPFYNFKAIKDYLKGHGIVVTPAKKEEGDYLFKPLKECQFLKRAFVEKDVLLSDGTTRSFVLAPLEMASILKSLVWQVRSREVTTEVQTRAAIESANKELWMHGREVFEKYHQTLLDASERLGFYKGLETFDEITQMYVDGSYATADT